MSRAHDVIIAGAAETDQVGKLPGHSTLALHLEAAVNAVRDAGLGLRDIDGIATVSSPGPVQVAHALGIVPRWIDGTGVGGTSFLLHVRHAAAAIRAGYARTVLVTHGESGRSRVGSAPFRVSPSSPTGQFEVPYGTFGATTTFTITALRYMKDFGLTHEQLAYVAVAQRRWAAKNPRAAYRDPITVDDVLASRLIAYPFHLLECCLVTDGGGALVITSGDRAGDFAKPAVHVLGTGESAEAPMISQMADFTESQAFRLAGQAAFAEAGIGVSDVRHLMIYDAFAHVPIYGLEALGFTRKGEAGAFIADGHTEPGGGCRSTPTAGAFPTPTPGCTACSPSPRRYARSAARRPPRSRPLISASCSATAGRSPRPACSSSAASRAELVHPAQLAGHAASSTSPGSPARITPGAVGDHVLAEDKLLPEPATPAQHLERLRAAFAGDLVGGGHDASSAGLDHAELDGADADAAPAVLGPGQGSGHYHAGPEPGHRDRLPAVFGEPAAEFVERAGAREQQGVPVGEADDIPVPPVFGIDRPPGRIIQVDQAHPAAEISREPCVTLRSRGGRQHGGAPDGHLQQLRAPSAGAAIWPPGHPAAETLVVPGRRR